MNKKVIGITGGIGCGKSVVMSLMKEKYKAGILLTDTIAHDLMEPGMANYKAITETFGTGILQEDGTIDRRKLGAVVFADQEKLALLSSITHPNVIIETKRRIDALQNDPSCERICLESALLLETELVSLCNETWYIHADQEVRIGRLMSGRGYTREYCLEVIGKQKPEEYFRLHTDVILDNSGSVEETEKQIFEALHPAH